MKDELKRVTSLPKIDNKTMVKLTYDIFNTKLKKYKAANPHYTPKKLKKHLRANSHLSHSYSTLKKTQVVAVKETQIKVELKEKHIKSEYFGNGFNKKSKKKGKSKQRSMDRGAEEPNIFRTSITTSQTRLGGKLKSNSYQKSKS